MPITPNTVLALDVGTKRIGVAVASLTARFPRPLITLPNDQAFTSNLKHLITQEDVGMLVVGLPRNLEGEDTDQTRRVRAFAATLGEQIDLPIRFQDEALTSSKAEAELKERGKIYEKGDIDALAATYILEDFLQQHGGDI